MFRAWSAHARLTYWRFESAAALSRPLLKTCIRGFLGNGIEFAFLLVLEIPVPVTSIHLPVLQDVLDHANAQWLVAHVLQLHHVRPIILLDMP